MRVVISCGAEVIARHPRSHEREDFVFDPLHYRLCSFSRPAAGGRGEIADVLLIDFGLNEPCQVPQGLLPAEESPCPTISSKRPIRS